MKFKLVTYNIWHGEYLEQLLAFLKKEQPDILCLQEVSSSGLAQHQSKVNLFTTIKETMRQEGVFERGFWADEGKGKFDGGVAILSRFSMLNKKVWRYERETTQILKPSTTDRYSMPRVLLGSQLKLSSAPIWIFTTHFTISSDASVTPHQLEQAEKVAGFLKSYSEYIFCGDLNTPHGSEVFDKLKGQAQDMVGKVNGTLHPVIHPVGYKGLQVDHVFAKGDRFKVNSAKVPVIDGSDHLPVVVEFEVEG